MKETLPALLGGEPVRPQGPPRWPFANPSVKAALDEAYAKGWWGMYNGPNVEKLRGALAAYQEGEHVELCSSGTAAVELALRGMRVGTGDEVVMAAYDFKGNFVDILTVGALPALVDVNAENLALDVGLLEAAITEKTKAILATHLHGGVVPMPEVMAVAAKHGLPVLEDAAQMPGGHVCGRKAGNWGNVAIFSFGGSKLLSAGRGGAVVTNEGEIAQRIRLYVQRGNHAYPLSELQASVLIPQLKELDEANQHRAENVDYLLRRLGSACGLEPFRNRGSESQPGYYKLGFHYDEAAFSGLSRDRFVAAIRAEGIAMDAGFRALHRIHSPKRFRAAGHLDRAARADETVVKLHHPILLKPRCAMDEIVRAVEKIRKWADRLAETDTE